MIKLLSGAQVVVSVSTRQKAYWAAMGCVSTGGEESSRIWRTPRNLGQVSSRNSCDKNLINGAQVLKKAEEGPVRCIMSFCIPIVSYNLVTHV